MKDIVLTLPSLLFVVGTRAALAFGAGLLASPHIPSHRRRGLGLTLVAIGILTTAPAAMRVFGGSGHTAAAAAARADALRLS